MQTITEQFNYLTKNWKKMTSLVVAGSLLFGMIMPPISFASSLSQKKDQLREPLTIQMGKAKSNIYRTDENHRLRKESGFREGGRLASESKVLALASPYIPVDQFSKVSQSFSRKVKEQIYRNRLISVSSFGKRIPVSDGANSFAGRAGQNGFNGTVKGIAQQSKGFLSISQSIANQISYFVSRVSALHSGTEHNIRGMLVRNREKHSLSITEDEWKSEKFHFLTKFNKSLANYLEIYFEQYRVKSFEEMTDQDIKEGKKPLIQEEIDLMKEIELEFEKQANTTFRYVGITRVKVALWEGPGMVESEDVWMLAPLIVKYREVRWESSDPKYWHWEQVKEETGYAHINRGLAKELLKIKKKVGGQEQAQELMKLYVSRELAIQGALDIQDEYGDKIDFDLAHQMIEGDPSSIEKFELYFAEKEHRINNNLISNLVVKYRHHLWPAIKEVASLDHKGLMELGKRVANDIRLGDFADYVYVRDLVDTMLEVDVTSPINPLGLFGEFLEELYQSVRDGKNGVGDYAKALNDIFNLIKRNKEFYLQYKELMEKALSLLKDKGKNWRKIGLHKIVPIPGDQESLKPLMELIRDLEKGNDNSQGIVKVVGTVLLVLSSVLIGQEVLANGLAPVISSGISFIDALPIITGGSGFLLLGHQLGKESQNKSNQLYKGQENQNYPSTDVVDPYIERTAQFLGDTELVKSLFSFYQSVMGSIEEPGVRFLANIKDLMENPSKLNELKNFAEESARNASVIGNSPFNLSQDGQDNIRETARPYELVIVTDENKLLSKEEVINFLKRYQVPTEYVRVIHHPFKDEMFDLKSLVEKPENKLIENGYSLRVINNKYWLIIKELLKNSFIINGIELLELNLIGKKSVDSAA